MAKSKNKPKKNKKKGARRETAAEKAKKLARAKAKLEKKATGKKMKPLKKVVIPPRCNAHPVRPMAKFKTGGTLWAGGLAATRQAIKNRMITPELVIDLSGYLDDIAVEPVVAGNAIAKAILPKFLFNGVVKPPALLSIAWDDGGAPHELDANWWSILAKHLMTSKGDTLLCCQGGHGRTGTALSILLTLFGICGEDTERPDVVLYLRESYCSQAVETVPQLHYVEDMANTKTTAEPSDEFGWWINGGTDAKDQLELVKQDWWDEHDQTAAAIEFNAVEKPEVNGTTTNFGRGPDGTGTGTEAHITSTIVTEALRKAGGDFKGRVVHGVEEEDFIEEMENRHDNPQDFVGIKGA